MSNGIWFSQCMILFLLLSDHTAAIWRARAFTANVGLEFIVGDRKLSL